jgi:hypothetical protein
MAIACLRLLTFLPLRPLFNVPRFRLRIARSTSFDAPREYFRAIGSSLLIGHVGLSPSFNQARLTHAA